jgi:uncharacterized protein (TIGR00645 family)
VPVGQSQSFGTGLASFMNLKNVSDRDLTWYIIIHLVFVVSGVILALSDHISEGGHKVELRR